MLAERIRLAWNRVQRQDLTGLPLVGALLIGEGSLGLVLIALYKKDQSPWNDFLVSHPGAAFILGGLGLCGSVVALAVIVRNAWGKKRKVIVFTLIANAIAGLMVAGGSEAMVRVAKRQTPAGERVAGLLLIPKDWERIRHHFQTVWMQASDDLTYLAYDAALGWVVADRRQSANALYRSSRHGIRTREVGEVIERQTGKVLVALVGDSFTFGEEVSYDETIGAHLERKLSDRFQILNFGVPGYGIDQMYLRYIRDVVPWKPDIVIFSFISNDLERSIIVYPFIMFPEWDFPFSKPRFVQTSTGLELVNSPTVSPERIFSAPHITELPFLDQDAAYRAFEWEQGWLDRFDLIRLAKAWIPRWSRLNAGPDDRSIVALNRAIIKEFVSRVRQQNGTALLVYLPTSFLDQPSGESQPTLGRRLAETAGEPYLDATRCLMDVPAPDRFVRGGYGHYSSLGNEAVATCLADRILNRQAVAPSTP